MILGGQLGTNDREVMTSDWVPVNQVIKLDLIGENKKMFKKILPEIKRLIKKYKL